MGATSKKRVGRPTKEPEGVRASLGLRVRTETKRQLENAAVLFGRSQSQEAEFRLERSFNEEESFGGPESHNILRMASAAFIRGGQLCARARGHPEWSTSVWINDSECYASATEALLKALKLGAPPEATASSTRTKSTTGITIGAGKRPIVKLGKKGISNKTISEIKR